MKRLLSICGLAILFATIMAESTNDEEILRDGANKFTTKMFQEIVKSRPGESIAMSGFAVMPPLAQLALASVGESHDELLDSIGMPNDNVTKSVFSLINTQLRATKGITFKRASKVYVANKYDLNTEFTSANQDTFDTEIQNINFEDNDKAASEINAWVGDKTNRKINDFVASDTLASDTKALLVDAIYFKGYWAERFNNDGTFGRDFYVTNDKIIRLWTMFHNGGYKYFDNKELKFKMLEIPYEGNEASFVIMIPHDVEGIKDLEEKLKDPAFLEEQISKLKLTNVAFYIPSFKIQTTTNLKNILPQMGVSKLFDAEKARLDYILKDTCDNLYIDSAIQKAIIEVGEEGAPVPVVTKDPRISYIPTIGPSYEVFNADRPFFYAIRTKSLTLFSGVFYGEQEEGA